jgi:REP element-mobilizing transposase RayT
MEALAETRQYKDIVIDSGRFLVQQSRVKVYSFVFMPNHIHLYGKFNQDIKEKMCK